MVRARHKAFGDNVDVQNPYIETRRSNRRPSLVTADVCTSPAIQSRMGVTYRPYSPSALTKAYFSVMEDGQSIRGSARKFCIPEATLRDRVNGRINIDTIKSGKEPLFTSEEEAHLVNHLSAMASYGYGYSRAEVVDIASNYAVSLDKRDNDHPLTLMWFNNFMKRWPELKVRKPRGLELQRAKATSEETVTTYFAELEKILDKYGLKNSPERTYNIDEKGLKQNHTPPCIVSSCMSAPPAVTSGKGSTVTVIGCGNALGQYIPPYFVFPGKRMRQELLEGCTPGADGSVSDSGWSNSDIFKSYLSNHFLRYAQGRDEDKNVLVLYDGHKSHVSLALIDWAKAHKIIMFVLPAHTSHVLQPLDIGCFGPFERIYNAECHKYMRANSCSGIDRYSICRLACKTYTKALSPENLQSSFKKSGIFPFDSSVVDKSAFIPAKKLKKCEPNKTGTQVQENNNKIMTTENGTDKKTQVTVRLTAPPNFFMNRENEIGQSKKIKKKRRCLGPVVSGKAITEDATREKIQEHQESTGKQKKLIVKIIKKKPQLNKNMQDNTSNNTNSSPQPGPSGLKRARVDDDETTDEEECHNENDKCCVCHRFRPVQLANSLYFTPWGQCMFEKCLHWTHIKYCCNVKRLRAKDTFFCPCHGVPCTPSEE